VTPSPQGRPRLADRRDPRPGRVWRFDAPRPANAEPREGSPSFLSVVIPARDEAECLPRLLAELAATLRPLRLDDESRLEGFEVILIDDGSTDETPRVLDELAADFPELRPIRLRNNAGQSAATFAGFRAARGSWIATLDADLQNDPADLATLWRARSGFDAVLGWRRERRDSWSKRLISRWANRVRNAVLGQSIRDTGCSTRIFRRELAARLPMFDGAHRFLGPLLLREGATVAQVPVNHRARPHGESHYDLRNRSFRVVVDLLGVAWLMRRAPRFEVFERDGGPAAAAARGEPAAIGEAR